MSFVSGSRHEQTLISCPMGKHSYTNQLLINTLAHLGFAKKLSLGWAGLFMTPESWVSVCSSFWEPSRSLCNLGRLFQGALRLSWQDLDGKQEMGSGRFKGSGLNLGVHGGDWAHGFADRRRGPKTSETENSYTRWCS